MTGKRTKQNKKARNGKNGGGDVPSPAKHTYHTISTSLPTVTQSVMIRSIQTASITATAGADTKNTYYFSLANAGSGSTGFFDQYKLEAIRFTVVPENNAVGLVTNSTTDVVPFYCVIDYDDASNLSSVQDARAYSNCMVLGPGESGDRIFKPRMAISAYTGAFGGFANVAPMWLDAASSTVQHYGIKTIVPACATGQTQLQSWSIVIEYYIHFRNSI